MARKPNYRFARLERERNKAAKKAERARQKAERAELRKRAKAEGMPLDDDLPPPADTAQDEADGP